MLHGCGCSWHRGPNAFIEWACLALASLSGLDLLPQFECLYKNLNCVLIVARFEEFGALVIEARSNSCGGLGLGMFVEHFVVSCRVYVVSIGGLN